ncbi:hypothetical protein [Staphylococcus saprophyticus]|uniref:hypothetical protein n=1 Tax=Staphylococcus saprophyticus TaxID=29385 RepID=UPI000853CC97|nr:hypothetical protein [Staphylococcus saprophyticus]MDW4440321.1 hypothetical protein [Staphylococcus saprophyticus]OEK46990.1 hypothetical protein ASS92_02755 [Staphylococcus saprophyticus]WFR69736.1 hypothetical protein QA542_12745 [Staphylococcus saprophyticus]
MKNTNAKNEDWLPIVTSLGLTILSDFLDDPLYTKIMTAIMILVLIYTIIRGVITTRYSIKTQDPNIKTRFSIKVDYWLLFVRNMIFYGFLATLFFVSIYLDGQTAWLYIAIIVISFVLFFVIISKLEKKTEIIDHEDD